MTRLDERAREELTASLSVWQQGDCVVDEFWFVFRVNPNGALTMPGENAVVEGSENAEIDAAGFMVLTQTCDLVRDCDPRPFIQVSPLVEIDDTELANVRKGRILKYAFIPGLAAKRLVADLDRVMTLEKAVLRDVTRVPGCLSDGDSRQLTLSLSRKTTRFAFPDDFVEFAQKLTDRLRKKHGKISEEGAGLQALREIRVRADDWNAGNVELMFWFIREEDEPNFKDQSWDSLLEKWLALVPKSGRFSSVDGQIASLDDLTARDYVESDPLDLDNLTLSSQSSRQEALNNQ